MAKRKKSRTKRAPAKRAPKKRAPKKTAGGRRPRADPAPSRVKPRGATKVQATCTHESGSHPSGRDELHPLDLPALILPATLAGVWVSAGALVYGEPVQAVVDGTAVALVRTNDTCVLVTPIEDDMDAQGVFYRLANPAKVSEDGTGVSLCWRNKSGKRCAHHVGWQTGR